MKTLIIIIAIASVLHIPLKTEAVEDPGLTSAQMAVLEIVISGLVNMYSTNLLIAESYGNGGIDDKEALAAVERNRDFLKVLNRYAVDIRRQSVLEDKKTIEFLHKVTDICTNLDMQLGAIETFVDKNDPASSQHLERYRERLEKLIQSLLTTDLAD